MSNEQQDHPWGEPLPGESGAAWRAREIKERMARDGGGRMDGRTYTASEFAESAALHEAQQERTRREGAAVSQYEKDRRVKDEAFQSQLDAFNRDRAAREKAEREAEAAALAEATRVAKAAWDQKQKAEEDERIRKWHRDQQARKPGQL